MAWVLAQVRGRRRRPQNRERGAVGAARDLGTDGGTVKVRAAGMQGAGRLDAVGERHACHAGRRPDTQVGGERGLAGELDADRLAERGEAQRVGSVGPVAAERLALQAAARRRRASLRSGPRHRLKPSCAPANGLSDAAVSVGRSASMYSTTTSSATPTTRSAEIVSVSFMKSSLPLPLRSSYIRILPVACRTRLELVRYSAYTSSPGEISGRIAAGGGACVISRVKCAGIVSTFTAIS